MLVRLCMAWLTTKTILTCCLFSVWLVVQGECLKSFIEGSLAAYNLHVRLTTWKKNKWVKNLIGNQKNANHIKFSPESGVLQSPLGMSRNILLLREVRDKGTTAAKWTRHFLINMNDLWQKSRDGKFFFWARWRIKKDVFSSCHERGTKKKFWVPIRNRTSDLRICAPMLYHWRMLSHFLLNMRKKRIFLKIDKDICENLFE